MNCALGNLTQEDSHALSVTCSATWLLLATFSTTLLKSSGTKLQSVRRKRKLLYRLKRVIWRSSWIALHVSELNSLPGIRASLSSRKRREPQIEVKTKVAAGKRAVIWIHCYWTRRNRGNGHIPFYCQARFSMGFQQPDLLMHLKCFWFSDRKIIWQRNTLTFADD